MSKFGVMVMGPAGAGKVCVYYSFISCCFTCRFPNDMIPSLPASNLVVEALCIIAFSPFLSLFFCR